MKNIKMKNPTKKCNGSNSTEKINIKSIIKINNKNIDYNTDANSNVIKNKDYTNLNEFIFIKKNINYQKIKYDLIEYKIYKCEFWRKNEDKTQKSKKEKIKILKLMIKLIPFIVEK